MAKASVLIPSIRGGKRKRFWGGPAPSVKVLSSLPGYFESPFAVEEGFGGGGIPFSVSCLSNNLTRSVTL